jgi:hypothetical protein
MVNNFTTDLGSLAKIASSLIENKNNPDYFGIPQEQHEEFKKAFQQQGVADKMNELEGSMKKIKETINGAKN